MLFSGSDLYKTQYPTVIGPGQPPTYKFRYDAASNHINRKRLERNRERIAKQTAGQPTVPAPKRVPKGFCISFVRNGSCNKGESCKYKREIPQQRGRSKTPNGGRGCSPGGRARSGSQPSKQECKFYKVGKCDRGDKCRFVHKGQPSVPAPSDAESGGGSFGRKGDKHKKKTKKKERKKSKSSSRSSRNSRSSKSSKGSKGSKGSGKGKKPSIPAAVCLLDAMLAGSASSADGYAFREDMLSPKRRRRRNARSPSLARVRKDQRAQARVRNLLFQLLFAF